jgi:hypothetical protein
MSALGHKRTCAAQERMSALPPKVDMQCLVFNAGDADGYAATTCVAAS